MRKSSRTILIATLWAFSVLPVISNAFCEDPQTKISGYHVPLSDEIRDSVAIVIGQVVKETRVYEVIEDPEFYFSIFTVLVERQLKGELAAQVPFRIDYDSGNYRMSLGERHILFVRKWPWKIDGAAFQIDPCGSSETLPDGANTVEKVIAALRKPVVRPNASLERTRDR
jgi:hypothetical protein